MSYLTNNWIGVTTKGNVLGIPFEFTLDYRSDSVTSFAQMGELWTDFRDTILSDLAIFQHAGCTTNYLKVFNRSISRPSVENSVTIVGEFTDDPLLYTVPSLAWGMFKQVGLSYKAEDDALETGFPIQRGYVFLPGFSDEWMSNGGKLVPAGVLTAWNNFRALLATPIAVTGNEFTPIVRGNNLYVPDTDPPEEKRGEVYAFVEDLIWRRISHLDGRMSPIG